MKHEHALTRRIGKDTFTFKLIVFSAIYIFLMQGDLSYADRIMSTYNVPENSSGLAWDGNLIWIGGVGDGGDWIRSFDPVSGQISDSIEAPVQDCIGLAYVEGRLSYLSPRSDTTYFVSPEGYDVAFENPIENLGGLGVHGNSLWSATYSQPRGTLIKITENGRTLRSMPFSGRHSRDMAFHEGRLYVADRLSQEIRVVNPETGRFIKTFPTPGINPDGITSDGDFLWLLDDGDEEAGDLLYKIHVAPDGNIRFSRIYHNFGSVVIGEEPEFDIWIYNDGDRTASLSDFEFRNGNDEIFIPHMWLFPEDGIIGGDSAQFTVTFRPAYADSVGIEFSFSFDVDPETYWINFEGKGISNRRDIIVHTRILDFGSTRTGEFVRGSNLRYLEIENNGGGMLTFGGLRIFNQAFFLGFF
ncbi:hypothetical protein H8D57_03385 [bacterium]|nr:hypothetical protein [bacterium]